MASGAGINSVGNLGGIPILTVPPGASTPAAVAGPTANYGTNSGAPNQPGVATVGTDSGVVMLDAKGFTKWTIQIIGPGKSATGTAAFNITILGTVDPTLLYEAYQTPGTNFFKGGAGLFASQGTLVGQQPNQMNSLTAIPATSWDVLPMQATGTTVVDSNPLVTGVNTLGFISGGLVAIRAVLTGTAPTTGTAPITVVAFAVP
jgi:hypothetical protein